MLSVILVLIAVSAALTAKIYLDSRKETNEGEKFSETLPTAEETADATRGNPPYPDFAKLPEGTEVRGVLLRAFQSAGLSPKSENFESELKKEADEFISAVFSAGLNTVYFDVFPGGAPAFPSEKMPGSSAGDFDILGYLVSRAHGYGIEVCALAGGFSGQNFDLSRLGAMGSAINEMFEKYPVNGLLLEDPFFVSEKYGADMALALSKFVSDSKAAAGSKNASFGIMLNAASTPADTFANALAHGADISEWIKGGNVDYICPSPAFDNSRSGYIGFVRSWSAFLDSSGAALISSDNAAVYTGGDAGVRIPENISYSRGLMGVKGNILCDAAAIINNQNGLCKKLSDFFENDYTVSDGVKTVDGVVFTRPENNGKTELSATYILASSDRDHPVTVNGAPQARSKSGFISFYTELKYGENVFVFSQNGADYTYTITRNTPTVVPYVPEKMNSFTILSISPAKGENPVYFSGETITVSAKAPAGCTVTAKIGNVTAPLYPTVNPQGTGLLAEVYTGSITLPRISGEKDYTTVGDLFVTAVGAGGNVTAVGSSIRVVPEDLFISATVTKDYAPLKVSTTSSFYDDYLWASDGLRARVTGFKNGFYRLSFGAFVYLDNLVIDMDDKVDPCVIKSIGFEENETFDIVFYGNENPAADIKAGAGKVDIYLLDTTLDINSALPDNLLFSDIEYENGNGYARITLTMINDENFYGFNYTYPERGEIRVSFRLPHDTVVGKTVILDAGHGGTDPGALGFIVSPDGRIDEKNLNTAIILKLKEKLEAMGVEVVLSRPGDDTVDLYRRMDVLDEIKPELSISVHHNSLGYSGNATTNYGTLGLYWASSGIGLTRCVSKAVAEGFGVPHIGADPQELAMCRNHKFPQTLVEMGFVCSDVEFERMLDPSYPEKAADMIIAGIEDYYEMQRSYMKK